MSSNIRIQRICQHCGNEFTAQRITSHYCSHKCNNAAYKAKLRNAKVDRNNKKIERVKRRPIDSLKTKEFLTVRDVATLLNFSTRTTYRLIKQGRVKGVNLAQRKTLVRRSDIDTLFEQIRPVIPQPKLEPLRYEISDCYNYSEIRVKYGISDKALSDLIKRNGIPKIRKGRFAYVPKTSIDKLFS